MADEAKILPFISIRDKLVDLITGLGGSRDRTVTAQFGAIQLITDIQLEAAYRTDWIARKIIDIVPQDMVRTTRQWRGSKEQITALEALEKSPEVNLWPKMKDALGRARLLGGSAIYIGVPGDNTAAELDPKSVRKDTKIYLTVLSRRQLSWAEIDGDPTSDNFGNPKMWQLNGAAGATLDIHPSRIIKFVGAPLLATDPGQSIAVWGDSVLQYVWTAVVNASSAQQHIAGLIPDSRTDVIYVPALGKTLADAVLGPKLIERFRQARDIKSNFNMLLLEGNGQKGTSSVGESWEQRTTSFTQLPEVMQKYLQIAAASADIPITRFLSESPGGENSTGEADMRNYYDHINARRTLEIAPALHRLDDVLMYASLGERPAEIYSEFGELWALNGKEKADVFLKKAQGARHIMGATGPAIMDPRALGRALENAIIEDGTLPGVEDAVEEFGGIDNSMDDSTVKKLVGPKPEPTPFGGPANGNSPAPKKVAADKAPSPLYVRRQLLNTRALRAWATSNGIVDLVPAEEMHVTIVSSGDPVDWLKMGSDWAQDGEGRVTVAAGGPRVVEKLGEKATVLEFSSTELSWRHMSLLERGASSDFPDYIPHVTLSMSPQTADLTKIKPFTGSLEFGPEIFEERKTDA